MSSEPINEIGLPMSSSKCVFILPRGQFLIKLRLEFSVTTSKQMRCGTRLLYRYTNDKLNFILLEIWGHLIQIFEIEGKTVGASTEYHPECEEKLDALLYMYENMDEMTPYFK